MVPVSKTQLQRRIDAAMGRVPCDLLIRGVTFLDVFACRWRSGDVAIIDGVIVGIEPGLKAKRTIEAAGKWLVPGFIDAHVHVESSLVVPQHFEKMCLARGTTTAICDPHEMGNVRGVEGIRYFLEEAQTLDLDLRVMLSSCIPATHLETNGAGTLTAADIHPLLAHSRALGLAEMMNVPGVLNNDPQVLDKLVAFSGRVIDGHCPLVHGQALSAYAAAGISSCHESSRLEEAQEKLTKGLSVWIREGSVAKDLEALVPLLDMGTSPSIGFCTDDRNPLDIEKEGHIDHLTRTAIRYGIAPEIVYRSASWSVARHYRLDGVGAIAPGYRADLCLLDDAETTALSLVLKSGVPTPELVAGRKRRVTAENTVRAVCPQPRDLEGVSGNVHVIGVEAGKIITQRMVKRHDEKGVARLSVLERYGHGGKPANGYAFGFGESFDGAIGSSVGHDSHNLIVAGSRTGDMKAAFAALIESGGGFCVVKDGEVKAKLALPMGGLMTTESPETVATQLRSLHSASRAVGCELAEPFLQLAFLSLPVIPSLKLTDKGLVDVDAFKLIDVRAS